MKRALFFLFISGGLVTSAAAQSGGWDAPSGWDTPKKAPAKKTTKTGYSTAAGAKAAQNGGAAPAAPQV